MKAGFLYGRGTVEVKVPDDAIVYESQYPEPGSRASDIVAQALAGPLGDSRPFAEALAVRRPGPVVVVVSDITRPVPYTKFLASMLASIESAGVARGEILVLVATGMHRTSTPEERLEMLGPEVAGRYRVADHSADDEATHEELPGASRSGNRVRLDRRYLTAGFRMTTGLVEPHFMAGYSGGRKAVFPGLADLASISRFHGYEILSNERARNCLIDENPCHEEALSVALLAPPDFTLNVVLNRARSVVAAFAGGLEPAHAAACEFVRKCACPAVKHEADVVVTSCGGYPLDATFYQCVKGMVSCLPAVRTGGTILTLGSCSEGVGSEPYRRVMAKYAGAGRWRTFLADIARPGVFTKDQWEFQMQCRALAKVGEEGVALVTDGLDAATVAGLSVRGVAVAAGQVAGAADRVAAAAQREVDRVLIKSPGARVAVFPEGPYCAPVAKDR